ncbi:MAG: L-iditol 2-dehydrogenase [Thermodesulfobacteriota bacterium]|nr:L-iditol 2-dehydrogenase [Thermodesulfobacteriota bacterium]
MRVAMYYNNRDVRIEEMPMPEIGPREILVKVWESGICGSDVLEWYRLAKAPLVLGHEIAGEIARVGNEVHAWKPGDRVFVSHHVPCNMCRYCLEGHESCCDTLAATNFDPGGFSEYIRVPEINVRNGVYALPDDMSYDQAVFIEPLACVYRGQQFVGWQPARRVLIIGCGIAGLLHLLLARSVGASKIAVVDVNEGRLQRAVGLGADIGEFAGDDLALRLKSRNDNQLFQLVLVCTGAESAIQLAFSSVDRGGAILFFAPTDPGKTIPFPFNELWRKEVTITSSYAGSPRDIVQAMELIRSGAVDVLPLITHRLPLAATQEGFRLVAEAGNDSMKVIIEPQL